MKRHESLIPLSRFHRSVLFLALIAKKNAPPVQGYPDTLEGKVDYALSFYNTRLKPHFQLEETQLVPILKGRHIELDRLMDEMIEEHTALAQLFGKLQQTTTFKEAEQTLDELGFALEKHIRKEERVIFQKIQELIPEQVLKKLTF